MKFKKIVVEHHHLSEIHPNSAIMLDDTNDAVDQNIRIVQEMVDENQELQEGVDNPEEAIERMEKSYEARYGKSSYAFHEEIAIKSREKLAVNIKNDYIEVIKKK